MSQSITLTTRPDGVALLTFDQPASKANVLTRELWTAFGEALAALATRTDVKGLVLASAKSGIFIAGADLKLLANAHAPNDPDVRAFIEQGLRVLEQLEALPFPTCAAIDGAALGGGLEVALACDSRVCGTNPKVQLGLPEVKLGLIPGWGGTQRLPRVVGASEASEMLASAQSESAENSATSGLADKTVASDRLIEAAVASIADASAARARRAKKLAPLPAVEQESTVTGATNSPAAREAVRVMGDGAALPLYDGIALETEAFMRLAGSAESKRLIAEFFNRKK